MSSLGGNCTGTDLKYGKQASILLQQVAFVIHVGVMVLSLAGFHWYVWYKKRKGVSLDGKNPTILALRLGRELLENTLMWAAMLNIASIAKADFGMYIAISAIAATVVAAHVQAVLAFRRKVVLHDDSLESFDVALCFHLNGYFSKKHHVHRLVVISSVPLLTFTVLVVGRANGEIADLSIAVSDVTASFLLALFSSLVSLKPAVVYPGWDYRSFQRAFLRRQAAEKNAPNMRHADKFRVRKALSDETGFMAHVLHIATLKSTLIEPARLVVYR